MLDQTPHTPQTRDGYSIGVRVRSMFSVLCVFPVFWVMSSGVIIAGLLGLRSSMGWWCARAFCSWTLWVSGCRASVAGLEHIPKDSGFVLAANHQSHFDGLFLIAYLPRMIQAAAKRELYAFLPLGLAFWAMGFIRVDRKRSDTETHTVGAGARALQDGACLLVFPEGTRSDGQRVHPFKTGAARMALDAGVPIVPVGIAGTERVMAAKSWVVRPGPIRLEVGPPIPVSGLQFEDRKGLTERTFQRVVELKEKASASL